MPYIAVLVESPAKCQKIEKFLGSPYKCMATFGHLRTLNHLNKIDIDNNFKPTYSNITSKNRQIISLRRFIAQADDVMLAADDDREGEAIAWHVCKLFNLSVSNTKRIIFHEITKTALKNAVSNPIKINMEVVRAQQARQILDLLVGFKISPILWNKISYKSKTGLSAGRCQTPALRLIYENQKIIDSSPGRKVYNTTGYFTDKNLGFTLNKNYEGEEEMGDFLESSVEHEHKYTCGSVRKTIKKPPTPFTTSALQQAASNEFRLSPKATMGACQKLYEGGYITYMRTDSVTYSLEFINKAKSYINNKYGEEYVKPNIEKMSERADDKKKKKKKSKKDSKDNNAQEAHEAIRPTDITRENIDDKLGNREIKVYKLIRRNTLESCMASAKYNAVTAKITAPEETVYKYSTEQVVFPGWKIVNGYEETNKDYAYLRKLKSQIMDYKKIISKVTMKDLKSHYTEAKLVQLLEKNGIGRPSTFSSLVEKIQERGYVKKDNVKGKPIKCIDFELEKDLLTENETQREFGGERNKLVIQQLGILVMDFLTQHFQSLFEYSYTKEMEDTLDLIAKGDYIWHHLCRNCLNEINRLSEPLGSLEKLNIKIDDDHTYIIGKYGPVIKYTKNNKTSFKKAKSDLDIGKLKKGLYSLEDILDKIDSGPTGRNLGSYRGNEVILKKGKYGLYVVWGKSKINIPLESNDYKVIALESIEEFLIKPIILEISKIASIRNGKYGPYIYYKSSKMKKPKFITLDSSIDVNCSKQEAREWLLDRHNINV
jgi:DNA topoisomerase-1